MARRRLLGPVHCFATGGYLVLYVGAGYVFGTSTTVYVIFFPVTGFHEVVATASEQHVVSGAAVEFVVTGEAIDPVVSVGARDPLALPGTAQNISFSTVGCLREGYPAARNTNITPIKNSAPPAQGDSCMFGCGETASEC